MLDVQQEILHLRLANQHLARQRSTDARAMVAHLGAVQSQDYPAALWALGLRVAQATRTSLECLIPYRTTRDGCRREPMRRTRRAACRHGALAP